MLEKLLLIDGYEFVLSYYGKELLDKAEKGRVLAFRILYAPKGFERESETVEMLERFEHDFANEIFKIIGENPEWYERFELSRAFDGGWNGGYNNVGQRGTINADRYLIMSVRENKI